MSIIYFETYDTLETGLARVLIQTNAKIKMQLVKALALAAEPELGFIVTLRILHWTRSFLAATATESALRFGSWIGGRGLRYRQLRP
jgi:hypothetical protein